MVDGMVGPYRLLSRVASGAQATVYRATDTRSRAVVALKVLDPRLASDPAQRKRLEREARLAASLNHPNIVQVLDIGEDDGTPYVAMEYLWRSLDSVISDEGRMGERRTAEVAADLAAGLEAAHGAGIIHRDIKPQNVLLTSDGVAQLTDFGIAHARDMTALTRTGARLGTPHYMSPEQVDGKAADERSDIYSLGCVMYHMLTGSPPFRAESAMAVMRMHLDAVPAPLAARSANVAPGLARIVERCMAKDPSDRFTTAAELRRELTRLSQGDSAPDPSGGPAFQRFEIGDDDGSPSEQLTTREIAAAMLQPDDDLSSDKACRNCGLGAEANRLYCLRCGFSEWRAYGQSVFAPPLTTSGAARPGRKDPVPEQALAARAVLLLLLAAVLASALAALLVWSDRDDGAGVSAGFDTLLPPSAGLDLPIVKRLRTVSGGGETRVEFDPGEVAATGISVISFRARFGGIATAITVDPSPETPAEAPPEPVYRQFSLDVFAQPDIGADRFILRFEIPEAWLAERDIDGTKIRLWTNVGGWTPLETFHIAGVDGVAVFLGFAPRAGAFAIGALP